MGGVFGRQAVEIGFAFDVPLDAAGDALRLYRALTGGSANCLSGGDGLPGAAGSVHVRSLAERCDPLRLRRRDWCATPTAPPCPDDTLPCSSPQTSCRGAHQ